MLDFAVDHLRDLDAGDPIWSEPLDPYLTVCDKALIETSLLLLVVSRVARLPAAHRSRLRVLARLLAPRIRTPRNLALLMRHPQVAAALSIGHFALEQSGEHDAEFDRQIRRAWSSGQVEATERLPYRAMDVRWIRALLDGGIADQRDLYPHSILATPAHPIHMSVADTYALTHVLMYLTDFGRASVPDGIDVNGVRQLIDACIANHLLTENLDLLGELLMGSAIIERLDSPYAQCAWSVLTAAWDRLGFLPSPTFALEDFSGSGGASARSYAFRHLYHTTYVAGMLCALLLAESSASAATTGVATSAADHDLARLCAATTEAGEEFLGTVRPTRRRKALAGVVQTRPFAPRDLGVILEHLHRRGEIGAAEAATSWGTVLTGIPIQPEALFGVLSDALLIRAAQEYQLPTLASTLMLVAEIDAPLSVTFREATAFLLRQSLSSGAIGTPFLDAANRSSPIAQDLLLLICPCLRAAAVRLQQPLRITPAAPPASA